MSGGYYYVVFALIFLACSSREQNKIAEQYTAASQLPAGNPVEGLGLYAPCKTCHGDYAQGNKQLNAPALANSDIWYLQRQLRNFQKGIRGYHAQDSSGLQMAAMAKTLKDSIAIADVVAYIETMPDVQIASTIKGDIKKGERTYQSTCGSCHGPGAKGNEKMNAPRLNGLDDWYIRQQISKFKSSVRGAHPEDKFGAQMVPMMALLADEQAIDDVIAYIRSTTQPAQ
ncbi:c-type cytochrome [Chryseolinea sp. T2]|uniref:c-type cytochrome n=1 Tax=Chryseolinea sp. T2 TaxID=3129255 RepID=UPI0030784E07